jgi:hypothetical protein
MPLCAEASWFWHVSLGIVQLFLFLATYCGECFFAGLKYIFYITNPWHIDCLCFPRSKYLVDLNNKFVCLSIWHPWESDPSNLYCSSGIHLWAELFTSVCCKLLRCFELTGFYHVVCLLKIMHDNTTGLAARSVCLLKVFRAQSFLAMASRQILFPWSRAQWYTFVWASVLWSSM